MNTWKDYCEVCKKETIWRFLDCEEHGRECNMRVCTDCGEGYPCEEGDIYIE